MAANILVVDDEKATRSLISYALRSDGYTVAEARDGLEAVRLLTGCEYDLVITDFVMPNMDGLKLVDAVRQRSPKTRVILITGYLSEESGRKILQGPVEFFAKPFDLNELRSAVLRLL